MLREEKLPTWCVPFEKLTPTALVELCAPRLEFPVFASVVLYFQPARELRLDISEFVYSFESGRLKIRCRPEGCRIHVSSREHYFEMFDCLTVAKNATRSMIAHIAVTSPVWTVTVGS